MMELLWVKSKVYVHPTKKKEDNIAGFLSLVRPQGASDSQVLISWVMESLVQLSKDIDSYVQIDVKEDGSPTSRNTEAVYVDSLPERQETSHAFSVPVADIYSLQLRPPSLGWWWGSVSIVTRSHVCMPPLFFHDGETRPHGSAAFDTDRLRWGGELFLSALQKLATIVPQDKGVYRVNPSYEVPAPQKIEKWDQVKWGLLERLAKVTQVSRRLVDRTPAPVRALLNIPEVEQLSQDFDSAREYLARWAVGLAKQSPQTSDVWTSESEEFSFVQASSNVQRRNPVTLEEWQSFFGSDGKLRVTSHEVLERIFHGGLEAPARPQAWLFLLNIFPWDSSAADRSAILSRSRNEYYRLKRQWWDDTERQANDEHWKDQKSRIEKDVLRTDRNLDIFGHSDIPHPDPESRFASVGANPHLEQLKDILITYNELNPNLGYVQGMTDLLSPLYVVLQDDTLAFTAFVAFMRRMERNFGRSQSGMRDQLDTINQLTQLMLPQLYNHLAVADSTHFFFFFRMLLVWFKREFAWDDVLRLWEVLWTDYLSSQFHLFVALAVLDLNKDIIIARLHHFDEVLKYINDLGMSLDLNTVLVRAEVLFNRFRKTEDLATRQGKPIPENIRLLLSREIIEEHEEPLN